MFVLFPSFVDVAESCELILGLSAVRLFDSSFPDVCNELLNFLPEKDVEHFPLGE